MVTGDEGVVSDCAGIFSDFMFTIILLTILLMQRRLCHLPSGTS